MPTLEERYKRDDIEDKLYIGSLVEQALQGEFGTLVKHLVTGLHAEWLATSESSPLIPADRYLGRFEGINKLLDRLELCIEMKRRLTEELEAKARVGVPGSEPSA